MKKGTALLLAMAGAAISSSAWAADYTLSWASVIGGDLSTGNSVTLTGTITFGPDTIHDVDANFAFPNALVGGGSGVDSGSITISLDITSAGPYLIDDLLVDELGQLVPGVNATQPNIAWRELIRDVASGNTLVDDHGTDYVQPKTRHYTFKPSAMIHVEEVFVLGGVTYVDPNGKTVSDPTAIAALPLVEKQVSLTPVPEPSAVAGLAGGIGFLGLICRRKR